MKNILSKLFEESRQREEKSPVVTYPQLAPLTSLQEVKDRAKVGWIAYRLATMLEIEDEKRDKLFYLSFSGDTSSVEDEELRSILELANSALEWMLENACVDEEIKGLTLPSSYNSVLLRVISEIQLEEASEKNSPVVDNVWEVYRDVIYAATQGKFLLIQKKDIVRFAHGELLCEIDIKDRKDIPKARELAQLSFDEVGLKTSQAMSYKLIISEAVTNVLKHAVSGRMQLLKDGDTLRIIIEDSGSGFPLKLLPQMILMSGFSTKKSLGQGFTLMMQMSEQIILETSDKGSTLILVVGKDDHR